VFVPLLVQAPGFGQNDQAAEQALKDIQRSHIEAGVPSNKDFSRFLERDLLLYFRGELKDKLKVEYQLLRNGPTQSGVSYPKFYAWVRVYQSHNHLPLTGAVRMNAVGKTHFEITTFITTEQICKYPSKVGQDFPAALCPAILNRAQAEGREI
jgi:hypothetical protein